MRIGHIGIRAGSKGVAGKNMRLLHGKPLMEWSLDQLLGHALIDHVVVSTDWPEARDFALEKGCVDIGLRPAALATDEASKWDVWVHALAEAEAKLGACSCFVDLDVTSPLRAMDDITGAIDLFERAAPDMVVAVAQSDLNPYFNLLETDEDGRLFVSKDRPENVVSRQAAPKVFRHGTGTYVLAPDYLRRASFLFDGHAIPYEVDGARAFDIDSELDFQFVEFLMSRRDHKVG